MKLAKLFRQPLADQAGNDVGGAAGRVSDNPLYRPRRIIGCRCPADRKRRDSGADQRKRGTP
jgi:hypothetical protein